jgi:UDP-N-acetylmuramate--alanine ligase
MRLLRPGVHVHLVGIGGIGLSAIARVLHGWGYNVSGSDLHSTALLEALAAEGIRISVGHSAQNLPGSDGHSEAQAVTPADVLVVVSSAVPEDNPELLAARHRGFRLVKRRELLGELTAGKTTIAVTGTHGKTTTTAMIAWILAQAGLDPTFIVGGVLQNWQTNAAAGSGSFFVIEADEYDRTFLGLRPDIAVVTTLEHDHPDCYPTLAEMEAAFAEFVSQVTSGGLLILGGDDDRIQKLARHIDGSRCRVEMYGLDSRWDWWAEGLHLGNHAAFQVHRRGACLGTCALQIPGRHNVRNALASLAASSEAGVAFGAATAALARFRGTARRFEVKGQIAGVTVVDDYAHHPTEIRATLEAARIKYPGRAIWAVFQPHTYSRTAALLNDFAAAFDQAEHVLITDIYAAREHNTLGLSGADVVALMDHPDAQYVETFEAAVSRLLDRVQAGEVVITLGAGDSYLIGERVLDKLRERPYQDQGGQDR